MSTEEEREARKEAALAILRGEAEPANAVEAAGVFLDVMAQAIERDAQPEITLAQAYDIAVTAGYYPTPYKRSADGKGLVFPPNSTGGYQAPEYVLLRPDHEFVGFRLPDGVIAIDVDDHPAGYGEEAKYGAKGLEDYRLRNNLPPLPFTFKITSRGPGDPGGKLLYRTDTDLTFITAIPGADVDIISVAHKFVAGVPGTVHHKTQTTIEGYDPAGRLCNLPAAAELPLLPVEWEALLIRDDTPDGESWDRNFPVDGDRVCTYLAGKLADPGWPEASSGTSEHAFKAVGHVLRCGAEGHYIGPVLPAMRERYKARFGTTDGQWSRLVGRAARRVKAPQAKQAPGSRYEEFLEVSIRCDCLPVDPPPANGNGHQGAGIPPAARQAFMQVQAQPHGQAEAPPLKRRKRTTAAETGIRRVEYLWDPYVPAGMITVFGGMEGSGKTQIALDLAANVTRGGRAVIILSPEDPREQVTVPRLIAAGADLTRCLFYDAGTGEEDVTLGADLDDLGEYAAETGAALVVFDPIVSVLDTETDGDSYKDVSRELGRLAAWADERKVTVLAVTHLRKASDGQALNKMMGSRAYTSKPRSVLMTAIHPEDPGGRLLAHAKSNVGAEGATIGYRIEPALIDPATRRLAGGPVPDMIGTSRVKWLGKFEEWSAGTLMAAAAKPAGRPPKIVDCAEFVRGYLAERDGVAPVVEVRAAAAAEGYGMDMLRGAEIKKLARITQAQTSGVTPTIHYWSLIGDDGKWTVPTAGRVEEWRERL